MVTGSGPRAADERTKRRAAETCDPGRLAGGIARPRVAALASWPCPVPPAPSLAALRAPRARIAPIHLADVAVQQRDATSCGEFAGRPFVALSEAAETVLVIVVTTICGDLRGQVGGAS